MSTNNNNPYEYYESIPYKETGPRPGEGLYSLNDYINPASITTFILILLVLNVLLDALGVYADLQQAFVIQNIQAGAYETEEAQQAAAEAVDTMAELVALPQTIATFALGIVFLVWTYRVCKNAHCLSLNRLANTPGWAVGWYFVPIANLWKPYYALSEAYIESHNSNYSHPRAGEAPLLLLWWGVHIITVIVGQISFRLNMSLNDHSTIDQLLTAKWAIIGTEGLSIPLNILTLIIVLHFAKFQREGFERRSNDYR